MSLNRYKKLLFTMLMIFCLMCIALQAQAKVSLEEAECLKKDLTPTGAERAGNADGTIPAWDGGMTGTPANISWDRATSEGDLPDPYAEDKVLFTITAQNMDQYADKLTPGLKKMFEKYPDTWKMHVYPSRRPACTPQWFNDNTYQNALSAELINDGDDGVLGEWGGLPFPIPKNGAEVMYNHKMAYAGKGTVYFGTTYLVQPNGSRTITGGAKYTSWCGWLSIPKEEYNIKEQIGGVMVEYSRPERRKGEVILAMDPGDYRGTSRGAWMYMPGQRRVRRAPSIGYDTPNPSFGGIGTYDDVFMYGGQLDRYNWNLKGKQEMFVPYNCYQHITAPLDDVLTPNHMNPEYIRWELHRVWANEAILKEGKRHCYGRRMFYHDEDSWLVLLKDNYDTRGTLWRTAIALSRNIYDHPSYRIATEQLYDFQIETYAVGPMRQGMPKDIPEYSISKNYMAPQMVRKLGKR